MKTETLLVELLTEELPPKALKRLGDAFAQAIFDGLQKRDVLEADASLTMFATPRRLAVSINKVSSESRAKAFETKLMPVSVALDANGKPTPALLKKLTAIGLSEADVGKLIKKQDGKAETLFHTGMSQPVALSVALQAALDEAIAGLPVPKVMSYQLADGVTTVQFVRPAHGVVALQGADVVPVKALGLNAGRITHGHRFQGAADIELKHADEYETHLETEGGVIASFEKRRHEIDRLLFAHAEGCGSTMGDDYQALLDEVTALVERPTIYVGEFDEEFLSVPAECLILTMKLNQKYFPLFFSEGGLSSRFLIVSNMRLDNPHNIIEGNQRVVRPRLADARFFFEQDKKVQLEERVKKLASVVYHNKLGSQGERVERVRKLAVAIATMMGADAKEADRAALLAKADLVTDMVGEFPELQGIMGRYYALHDGETATVADAIQQHYQPRFAGDKLPDSPVALSVALADKLETLAGLFSIGQVPTGDKDPYALRRHALGVLRMLIEKKMPISFDQLLGKTFAVISLVAFRSSDVDPFLLVRDSGQLETDEFIRGVLEANLKEFMFDRLRGYLRERDYKLLEIEAVLSKSPDSLDQLPILLEAVRKFIELPEAESLASANKRIGNILKKAEGRFNDADNKLFAEPAEKGLFEAMSAIKPEFEKFFAMHDYTNALKSLAPLKVPVDTFFDSVMVNADDIAIRNNRLALLGDLHSMMNQFADLSRLAK